MSNGYRKVMMENIRNERLRRRFGKLKKTPDSCQKCGKECRPNELFSYVDGNNIAITYNSKHYCINCYKEVHGGAG